MRSSATKSTVICGGKAAAPAVVFAAALALSVASGRPARLPGAALGAVWLLHVERAAVALGAVGSVWLVGWRALHGHFPIRFGNIEYSDALASTVGAAVEECGQRLDLVESYIGLGKKPDELRSSEEPS